MTLFAGREVALTAGAKVPGTSADTGIAAAVDDGLLEEGKSWLDLWTLSISEKSTRNRTLRAYLQCSTHSQPTDSYSHC